MVSDPNTTENNRKGTHQPGKKNMLVRYGLIEKLGLFTHELKEIPKLGGKVVVKTERGLEIGSLVGPLTHYKGGNLKMGYEHLKKYFEDSGIPFCNKTEGNFVRFANHEDISEQNHLRQISTNEINICRKVVKELDLKMKVVDAEHIFGGERIIFYFMAENRVDFRELVKKLAHEYQTRIEMRQIGARDEAKMLGDYETCGQECCCIRFLKSLKPVNMRMAKMQKATLDPSKISGYCGRLKCCLRYEDKNYLQLKKKLPRKNTQVKTPSGVGKVISGQILTQLVGVLMKDGKRLVFSVEELEMLPANDQPKINGDKKRSGEDGNSENEKKSKEPENNNNNAENNNTPKKSEPQKDNNDKD
jgi:cell fate regulator YaaT (PSP1 superfamily)